MKRIAIILGLSLVLGKVFISGVLQPKYSKYTGGIHNLKVNKL